MGKILTFEQVLEARTLRLQGKTKRELAILYEVSPTTIWENVFSTEKRIRKYTPNNKEKIRKEYCNRCEIVITNNIKGNYVPFNYKIGNQCISCYLEQRGYRYTDVINQ